MRSGIDVALIGANSDRFQGKCPLTLLPGRRQIPQGIGLFEESGSDRCVIETSTVGFPSMRMETGDWRGQQRILVRRSPFPGRMRTMPVEVGCEIEQLVFEIRSRPKQRAIEVFAANRPDQPFHKGMGERNIGDSFDLGHLQDAQIQNS